MSRLEKEWGKAAGSMIGVVTFEVQDRYSGVLLSFKSPFPDSIRANTIPNQVALVVTRADQCIESVANALEDDFKNQIVVATPSVITQGSFWLTCSGSKAFLQSNDVFLSVKAAEGVPSLRQLDGINDTIKEAAKAGGWKSMYASFAVPGR